MTSDPESWAGALPRKRVGAGALCLDAGGAVLLVRPAYKPGWEIPGGLVEAGESPRAALVRELREELGIDVAVGRLLVIDWSPGNARLGDGLLLVFDGGRLDAATASRIKLSPDELLGWQFFPAAELDSLVGLPMARRLRNAVTALETGRTLELEDGIVAAVGQDGPADQGVGERHDSSSDRQADAG